MERLPTQPPQEKRKDKKVTLFELYMKEREAKVKSLEATGELPMAIDIVLSTKPNERSLDFLNLVLIYVMYSKEELSKVFRGHYTELADKSPEQIKSMYNREALDHWEHLNESDRAMFSDAMNGYMNIMKLQRERRRSQHRKATD